jgi:hypothetical protein
MNITIQPFLYQLDNKGYMAWEYNPFHNFRVTNKDAIDDNSEIENGDIIDLDTPLLGFDLNHPVTIDI